MPLRPGSEGTRGAVPSRGARPCAPTAPHATGAIWKLHREGNFVSAKTLGNTGGTARG